MRSLLRLALLVLVAMASAVLAWQLRGCTVAPSERVVYRTRVDTVYAERHITRRDTVTQWRPRERVIYEVAVDTVRVEVPVPRDFRLHGIISPSPLRFEDGLFRSPRVRLTYFDPHASPTGRFQQDVYDVPAPAWALTANVGGAYGLDHAAPWPAVDARLALRWRRLTVYAGYGGYGLSPEGRGPIEGSPFVGLRLRLFRLTW